MDLSESIEEEDRQKSYSERVGELFSSLSEKYREDTINLAVSHLFILGGEESDSERQVQLGGSLAVGIGAIPEKAQYVALGHLHKPQEIKGKAKCFYSGSPLQYSKSEVGYTKCCYIVDVKAGQEAIVDKVYLKNYKPIEVWKCESVEEAIKKCEENCEKELWVYLEIKTDKYITQEDIKTMKTLKKDILEIRPIIKDEDEENQEFYNIKEKSMGELFKEFYIKQRMVEPSDEIMELFLSIAGEEKVKNMKPKMLKIVGLNSFEEEQKINFERLTEKGLFGIFGPTGSGKSTILDAITIALYGKITRTNKGYINTTIKNLNVSYEFEIGVGEERKTYIAERNMRVDKNGSYKTRYARLIENNQVENNVLAEGPKEVQKEIEKIIGLTSEDFTRSVVLPQGKFSEFLKLTGKDKRDMLERIFGLEKYGKI
jgi:hypothetical protein